MFKRMGLSNERAKDFVAGLVALVFVVTAGYLALNRFNTKTTEVELGTGGEVVTENGNLDNDERIAYDSENDESVAGTSTYVAWQANDYADGDISTGDYTVMEGDTLWEIAEAAYGNGSMWTTILDANSGSVDYLANGSQALIYAGQTLVIPAL